jgi:hypothetical protein
MDYPMTKHTAIRKPTLSATVMRGLKDIRRVALGYTGAIDDSAAKAAFDWILRMDEYRRAAKKRFQQLEDFTKES